MKPSPSAPHRILVVDDDEGLARFIAEVLADAGHEVEVAHAAAAARAAVERDGEGFDVIVTDLRMPGGSGLDLIAWARAYDPRIAVLAVTAFGSLETAVQAVRLGASDYIPKPFEADALLLAVDKALREHSLQAEVARLRDAVDARFGFEAVVARSQVMRDVVAFARRVADSPSTVLVTGPSGAGKEVIARAIHQSSRRRAQPFVAVNCAAIPDALLESELFGHKRGAFTGAVADRRGLFQEADGGTLLLDEVGDLPMGLQVKLLRALQEGEVRPVGASRAEAFDARVIAATHVDLKAAIAERRFREDLYYRLCVIELTLPGLADRADDVLPLAEHFLAEANRRVGREVRGLSGAAARLLCQYAWPGNVRELQNAIERAVNLCVGDLVTPDDLPPSLHRPREEDFLDRALDRAMTISELDRAYARRVIARCGGNKKRAAALLGVDRRTLYRWFGERDDEPGEG
ncbi:MAG: sigma-54 dependent transcriptional regulator [Polyangiales bacterium]